MAFLRDTHGATVIHPHTILSHGRDHGGRQIQVTGETRRWYAVTVLCRRGMEITSHRSIKPCTNWGGSFTVMLMPRGAKGEGRFSGPLDKIKADGVAWDKQKFFNSILIHFYF